MSRILSFCLVGVLVVGLVAVVVAEGEMDAVIKERLEAAQRRAELERKYRDSVANSQKVALPLLLPSPSFLSVSPSYASSALSLYITLLSS